MFTGLIQDIGTVTKVEKRGRNTLMGVRTKMDLEQVALGDSIAIDGYCQTVVKLEKDVFFVEIGPETMERTTARSLAPGRKVNLEPALRLSDRLGGHMMSGHVDGVGTIDYMDAGPEFWLIGIKTPPRILKYCVEKGSIAVDGISLTINQVTPDGFEIGIIPHTLKNTTLSGKKPKDQVNLEVDIMGKYVEKFVLAMAGKGADGTGNADDKIDLGFLAKHGFLK